MPLSHRCINFRHGSEVCRWEFDKDDQSLAVSVNGPLILDDLDLVIRAAIDGARLGVQGGGSRGAVRRNRGAQARPRRLVRAVPFFLYYPSRRQQPAALSALIDTLRL